MAMHKQNGDVHTFCDISCNANPNLIHAVPLMQNRGERVYIYLSTFNVKVMISAPGAKY